MWVGESLDEAIRTTLLLVIADHIIPRMSMFHRTMFHSQIHLHHIAQSFLLSC